MKFILFSPVILLFSLNGVAQNQLQLDGNNANVTLRDDGVFFCDLTNSFAGYEIPKNSGNHVAYFTTFILAAIETDGTIHEVRTQGPSNMELFPGPVSDNYSSAYYNATFNNSIWKVTRDQINFHVSNFGATGYTPDPAIANWPGNGNAAEGVAAQLAPYVDTDNNGIYNPLAGDFPYIQGDAAVYIIMNDEAGPHLNTETPALGVEIHAVFYQFDLSDDTGNTTFLNTKIYNRRDTSYVDFLFGIQMDADVGNYMDDYVGSDSLRSMMYGYNGDANDQGGNGQPGYGNNVPAFGVKFLNHQAGSALAYNNAAGPGPWPAIDSTLYHYMQAMSSDGTHFTNGGVPFNFMFTGNPFSGTGWHELADGNAPGDRRLVLSSQGQALNTGGEVCYDLAFVFNQETGNALENVNELLNTADYIQNFYNTNLQPCNQIFLQSDQNKNSGNFSIYPNPSNGYFHVQISQPSLISVFDVAGNLVVEQFQLSESGQLNLALENGVYILQIKIGEALQFERIVINR